MTIKRFLLLQRQYQTMLINFCATWAYIQGFSGFNAQLLKPKMHKTAPEFNENPSEIQNFPNEFLSGYVPHVQSAIHQEG